MVHKGGKFGQGSGEGTTQGLAPVHHVTVHDRRHDVTVNVDIPEDRCACPPALLPFATVHVSWPPVLLLCSVVHESPLFAVWPEA